MQRRLRKLKRLTRKYPRLRLRKRLTKRKPKLRRRLLQPRVWPNLSLRRPLLNKRQLKRPRSKLKRSSSRPSQMSKSSLTKILRLELAWIPKLMPRLKPNKMPLSRSARQPSMESRRVKQLP